MLDRINLLMQAKNLAASQFADQIGVQRSSVSHVLSGRNKPSLDFVMRIIRTYPELSLEWILMGKGSMTKNYTESLVSTRMASDGEGQMSINEFTNVTAANNKNEKPIDKGLSSDTEMIRAESQKSDNIHVTNVNNPKQVKGKERKIIRIVEFYCDDTFKVYELQKS